MPMAERKVLNTSDAALRLFKDDLAEDTPMAALIVFVAVLRGTATLCSHSGDLQSYEDALIEEIDRRVANAEKPQQDMT